MSLVVSRLRKKLNPKLVQNGRPSYWQRACRRVTLTHTRTIERITILYYWCRISVLSQCLVPGSSCAAKDQGMIVGLLWICDDITACNIFSVTSYRQQVFFQAHSDFI